MRPVVCPVVVGRDEELAVLDGELSRARDGAGGVAFLVGEAGIGKSRLAREAGARATAAGMVVLRGRAVQGGAPVPFRPLAEALHSGLRDRTHDDPALAPYRPALGQLVADGAGASHQQASPLVLLEAVVRLLRSLAGHRGLLLVLEDLHWADADTLSVVEYLADNLASEAALCLGTVRSDEPSSAGTLVDALAGRRAAAAIALRRLPPAEVAEMVAACAPEAELTAVGREVLERRAEGVPFLVEELLSAALARDGGPVSERLERAVPVSYRELVRSRLARVPAEARRTVQAAAVLGRGFDWTLLPEIAGLDPRDVLGALRAAVDAQLVSAGDDETFEFRHALLRESILAELLPPERRELALRAADVIQATRPGLPGELCELAADLRERGGDRDGAFRLLLEAGRRALARAALATAEITAERARSLGEGDPWSEMGADLLLAEILSLAGKVDRLREVGAEVLETAAQHPFSMGSPARQASVHLRIAQGIADAGDPEAAEPHVQRAAALAGADETAAIRLEALRARLAMARGDPEGAASSAARALNAAERAGLRDAACRALLVLARAALERGDVDEAADTVDRARLTADRADLTLWRVLALLERAALDELTTADLGHARQAAELAARTGAVAAAARADLQVARMHLIRFEPTQAEEHLERCLEACRRFSLRLLPEASVVRAALLARTGRPEEIEPALGEARADPSVEGAAWGEARAAAPLLAERRVRAREQLERAVASTARRGPAYPWTYPGLWVLLRAVEGDDARDALAVIGASVHRANRALARFAEAVVAGREGRPEEAAARFGEADRLAGPFPWHRHVARRLVAEAAVGDGWGDPGRWLRDDVPFFVAAGYERMVAACRGLLRRAGERVPRRGRGDSEVPPELRAAGVTSREVDVLRLIGEGLSNAEIAARLFLSPRTVQTHAISLLRKLGLESRAQLVAFAARAGAAPGP